MSNFAEVQVASQGALGLGFQVNKGTVQETAGNYRWYQWSRVGLGAQQMLANLPLAIASTILPRGQYKDGLGMAGMAELVPSLEEDFAWLLRCSHGVESCATIADYAMTNIYGDTELTALTGAYVHTFVPGTDRSELPWFTTRKLLPNATAAAELGEVTRDCRLTGIVVNFPNTGIITAQIGIAGIEPSWSLNPAWLPGYDEEYFAVVADSDSFASFPDWTQAATATGTGTDLTFVASALATPYAYDDMIIGYTIKFTSGPNAGEQKVITDYATASGTVTWVGALKVSYAGDTADIIPTYPVAGATVTIDNGVVPPGDPRMRVIGKPTPHDLPLLGPRACSVRMAVLIDTETDYGPILRAFRNAVTGGDWSSTPYKGDVHLRAVSPFMVTGTTAHALEFLSIAGNGTFSLVDTTPLVAGQPITAVFDVLFQEVYAENTEVEELTASDANLKVVTADDNIENVLHDEGEWDQGAQAYVGAYVEETGASAYAQVQSWTDLDELLLDADIFPLGTEAGEIGGHHTKQLALAATTLTGGEYAGYAMKVTHAEGGGFTADDCRIIDYAIDGGDESDLLVWTTALAAMPVDLDRVEVYEHPTNWMCVAVAGATVTFGDAASNAGAGFKVNKYVGWTLECVSGTGAGEKRIILSNTSDTLTLESANSAELDVSYFNIVPPPWMFRLQNGKAKENWPT